MIELGDSAPQAIAVGQSLTADLERLLGPDHPDTLNSRNSLAAAYQAAGRVAEAIPLFEQTLVGRERLLGADHPDTLTSQNNLAAAYQDAGRVAEAILLFELTLAARERLLGSGHLSTVNSRGNLAVAYQDAGRVAEAIPLFEQTLAARERVLGPDHPDTLRSRNNLAAANHETSTIAEVDREAKQEAHGARDVAVTQHCAAGVTERLAAGPLPRKAASDQVVVGAIPERPPAFLPRPSLLAQLNRASRGLSVLEGRPGVGKTQLAALYARAKLAEGWPLVAWVEADDTASLLGGLAEVADAVGLTDGPARDVAEPGQVMRRWLEADGDRCLLVFHDAEDPDALRPFLPTGGAARVVITTQQPGANLRATNIKVDVFSAEEALAVLAGHTGLEDDAGAAEVAAELGNLPLAIAQASAVIRGKLDYKTYLNRLRALPVEEYLIPEQWHLYPPGAAAVLLSLDAVQASDQTGVYLRVLDVMAVLPTAGVRRELLCAAGQAGMLADDGQRVAAAVVDQALTQLVEQALLASTIDGQTVIMHDLVARIVREGLARQQRLTAVCRAAVSAQEAYAATVAGSGRFAEAIPLFEQTLLGRERLLGADHPDTLHTRTSLAAVYRDAGRTADAIPLVQQILAARERLLGADHPSTLASRNNLASAYRAASRPAEAIPLFEQNLAACERLLGADHPRTLASRHNLDLARKEAEQAEKADHGPDAGP